MAGTIGIKIANGDFYPITGENLSAKKRLILTTVHDRQNSVQVDFYRSISKSMLDAQYIGSLVIENIRSLPKGEPSIELIVSSDMDGNITADAYDLDSSISGEHSTLNVSLKTLDIVDQDFNISDFDLEDHAPPASSYSYESQKDSNEEQRKFPWLIMGLATLFVVIAIVILWFFFLGGRDAVSLSSIFSSNSGNSPYGRDFDPLPPPVVHQVPPPPPVVEMPPPPAAELPPPPVFEPPPPPVEPPPPVIQAPVVQAPVMQAPVIQAPAAPPPARPPAEVKRTRPPAPVSSYRVPAVIPKNGIVYQIRWGDTLWEISEAFYRNPWLYTKIQRDNKIENPDVIKAGFNVRIYPLQ